ncbi:tyrosine-type recombinase/integrase [Luteimonas fraxinea]|uniref:tyrosine-type recombinase/integrase n=1 Tax=Luteimonas fraxinea TaxID=2901869 RepID=UPI001E652FC9|nr:site-specific integrase [Luteimonas fraxinea]MCD9126674.1 integrase arm-type DNA-binding domain-containing protein [Luteimonas fraxinea]
MARAINKLTALGVKRLKEPGRYSDGDGLYFFISRAGSRSWVFRYRDRTTGKHRDKGLGPERDVSLEQARGAARRARASLRDGLDPIDTEAAAKAQAAADRQRGVSLGHCVDQYIKAHRASWRNAKHADQWENTLNTYAGDLIALPVALIDTPDVLRVLEPIWSDKTETATRVRQRIEAVLDWAAARKLRSELNPARWRGHLDKLLPKPAKLKDVKPRPALAYGAIGAFLAELRGKDSMAARALELIILTASRPSEVTGARWGEIDFEAGSWTVPAERMKAGKAHRIPLSRPALNLLQGLPRFDAEFVFPGAGKNETMSTAAPLKVLKTMRPGVVAHGFRSTFRDWAADMTAFPREVAEQALAHSIPDKTEAAYRRTDLFLKRAKLMSAWADYCDRVSPDVSNVEPINRAG